MSNSPRTTQDEGRKPCRACEGDQFDGFICSRCGRHHHVTADGQWFSTWPKAPPHGPRGDAMKIRVTLKDPDTMQDAVDDAVKREPKPDGISSGEWADIREARAQAIKSGISRRFMQYGEYLDVEFEVNEDGVPESATVIPLK